MENKIATAFIRSMPGSSLMFGKHVEERKLDNETSEQHAERTWQQKVHVDPDIGQVFIPPFALKNALVSAGKWLSMPIKGEGKKTFTDRFRKGTLVVDRIMLERNNKPITMEDVECVRIFAPSDGKTGGPKRVMRLFPTVHSWTGSIKIYVLDNKITEDVLIKHIECVGSFVGFGAMRVENGGVNGRFSVEDFHLE